MTAHERSRETAASPDRVWALWSDTSTWGSWNPDVESMTLDGAFAAGTSGTMKTRAGRSHRMLVKSVAPGRSFELETKPVPATTFTFRCKVEPSGSGSRISQAVTMSGPLAFAMSPLAGDRVAKSFEPILNGLATAAETRA